MLAAACSVAGPAQAAAPTGLRGVAGDVLHAGGAGDVLRAEGDPLVLPVSALGGALELAGSRVTLRSDVLFAFDSSRLGPRAQHTLQAAARALPRGLVRVVGHTDDRGPAAYNLRLSRRRAAAVAGALARARPGVRPRVEGHGEREPVAANRIDGRDSPEGRARNRRVEIVPRGPAG